MRKAGENRRLVEKSVLIALTKYYLEALTMIQLKLWLSQIDIGFADTILLNELFDRMSNVGTNSEGNI